jgi:hypothetical protein
MSDEMDIVNEHLGQDPWDAGQQGHQQEPAESDGSEPTEEDYAELEGPAEPILGLSKHRYRRGVPHGPGRWRLLDHLLSPAMSRAPMCFRGGSG